jgi:formylmethanofuran dehydrogenase subunit E
MLTYATKFEFPPTKNLRLSIEKSAFLEGDHWLIKNTGTEVFDIIKGKLRFIRIDESTPKYFYSSLKDAFELAKWIIQKEEDEINYTRRCRQCGKFFDESQLKEEYGWNWCQECYDDLQD